MKISKDKYFSIMSFPSEWIDLGMLPDDLWDALTKTYKKGNEESSEHDRNGAFHWWLKKSPEKQVLLKLVALSFLDDDQIMATDVRRYIAKSKNADHDVLAAIDDNGGELRP